MVEMIGPKDRSRHRISSPHPLAATGRVPPFPALQPLLGGKRDRCFQPLRWPASNGLGDNAVP